MSWLDVRQRAISEIGRGDGTRVSRLRRHLEALGALLRIHVTFPRPSPLASTIRDAFGVRYMGDDQLVQPLPTAGPYPPLRDVVLSIKPQYSDKILAGSKTIELRRRFPVSPPRGTIAYIYASSPVCAMVKLAGIKTVLRLPVAEIWRKFGKMAQIEKHVFDQYYEGVEEGFALMFEGVRSFDNPLSLSDLRERYGFEPPQSYLYAKHELRKALRNESAIVSH